MSSSKLPAGYHTVTPALVVRDANAAIDFYRRAFGATEVSRRWPPATCRSAQQLSRATPPNSRAV